MEKIKVRDLLKKERPSLSRSLSSKYLKLKNMRDVRDLEIPFSLKVYIYYIQAIHTQQYGPLGNSLKTPLRCLRPLRSLLFRLVRAYTWHVHRCSLILTAKLSAQIKLCVSESERESISLLLTHVNPRVEGSFFGFLIEFIQIGFEVGTTFTSSYLKSFKSSQGCRASCTQNIELENVC